MTLRATTNGASRSRWIWRPPTRRAQRCCGWSTWAAWTRAVSVRCGGMGIYPQRMATFALVHGAWHDAWCWERVASVLRQAGHEVVAPQLPSDDGSADFDAYADVVCAALEGRADDVVVVAHSLAGSTGALVADRRPVRHLVYL